MPQIKPETVKIFDIIVVFDTISIQFPRDFVISSNTINNGRTNYTAYF